MPSNPGSRVSSHGFLTKSLEQCRRVLANEVHLLHSACKFKHHGKAIVAPKRVGAVFLRQTNSNIYHTALHGVMTAARTKIQTFQCLSVAERQRLKPCKTCVSVGTVGDELTMADALRVLS